MKDLLALFDGPLAEVRFPEVDGAALREDVASVEGAVKDVEAAAAAWAEAKRAVDARLELLLQKAQRALSYARVYAEGKPELDAQLAALVLPKWGDPRGTKTAEPVAARKRGRPRKAEAAAAAPKAEPAITLLPAGASAPASEAAPDDAPVSEAVVSETAASEPAATDDASADETATAAE